MDPAYAARYGELYRRHWWWRAREALVVAELRRLSLPRGRILDVGSGDGLFFEPLAQFGEPEGVEPDPAMLGPAPRHRQRIHAGPFETFEPGRRYSLILMLDVLEHLTAPDAFLRHGVALLEPGGRVVVTVPAFPVLWTNHDAVNRHVARYTRASLHRVIEQAGLCAERMVYFFHWLFFAKLAARAYQALARPSPRPPSVPPAPVNLVAWAVSRVEQLVHARRLVPFGSSLLAIARAP